MPKPFFRRAKQITRAPNKSVAREFAPDNHLVNIKSRLHNRSRLTDLNQAEHFPVRFFVSSGPATPNSYSGEWKGTASEAIYALKPVSFRYHQQYDQTQTIAFGLIAEEVAEVNPDLVGRNPEGQPESVRYGQINAMLLNEFLKEHRKGEEQDCKLQEQETTITELRSELRILVATVNKQASQLPKVSAQLQIRTADAREIASISP